MVQWQHCSNSFNYHCSRFSLILSAMDCSSEFTFFPCEHPRLVYNKYINRKVLVSCGYCSACMSRKLSKYIPLIGNESAAHKYSFFVTLTYNDDFCPCINAKYFTPKKDVRSYYELRRQCENYIRFVNNVLPILRNSDIQKFIKRIRKSVKKVSADKLRYFFCGDYGGTTFRPHYHGLFFFDDERIAKDFSTYVSDAWKIDGYSMGFTETETAYGNGQYVAAYTRSVTNRPVIYDYCEFAPKPLFSNSLGHYVFTDSQCESIIRNGSTEVTVYDVSSSKYRCVPLPSSFASRCFPTIPSFRSLSHCDRLAIYRIFTSCGQSTRSDRIDYLYSRLQWDSFFCDYIYNGFQLNDKQVIEKFDRIYYTIMRIVKSSVKFAISLNDYDLFIDNYLFNCFIKSYKLQCKFVEVLLSHGFTNADVSSIIDCGNEKFYEIDPRTFHPNYYRECDVKLKRLTKSKLNHQYLSLHPEYYQFIIKN